jgi:predicted amidophosphoribosyltransferase
MNNESVQQLISNSFIIIRDFISNELGEDPKELLGDSYWKILVDVNEVYAKEKEESDATLEKLDYFSNEILDAIKSYRCGECGSGLIEAASSTGQALESEFKCRSCEHTLHYENFIGLVINDFYETATYLSHTDGDDTPVIDCPSCGEGTYIFHENICATCGDSATHECQRCGCNIPPEEIADSNVCGYCAHMYEKLMAE